MALTRGLERTDLALAARKAIKDAIMSGELRPGSPLRMEELTRKLNVSSSPIREAFRLLERDGLVHVIPFRGAFVRVFDQKELLEVYEIREFLERGALQKAVPVLPPDQLSKLAEACKGIQEALDAGDHARFLEADVRFHQAIIDMAGNRQMSEMFLALVEQGKCFILGRDLKHSRNARREHVDLLKAITRGDTAEAIRLHHEHFRSTVEELTQLQLIKAEEPEQKAKR